MAVTDSFLEEVSEGDVLGIRIIMKNSLLVDPSFKDFDEREKLAKDVIGLYDEHDGAELDYDKSNWSEDYMNMLMVEVVGNFSHERIDHLKQVVRFLFPYEDKKPNNKEVENSNKNKSDNVQNKYTSYQRQKYEDQKNGRVINRASKIGTGVVVGGIAGGVVASVASGTIIVGVAVGATVAGVTVAIITNGE